MLVKTQSSIGKKKGSFSAGEHSLYTMPIKKYSYHCITKFRVFMMWSLLCECCEFMGNGGLRKCLSEVMEDKPGPIGLDVSFENWVNGSGTMLRNSDSTLILRAISSCLNSSWSLEHFYSFVNGASWNVTMCFVFFYNLKATTHTS